MVPIKINPSLLTYQENLPKGRFLKGRYWYSVFTKKVEYKAKMNLYLKYLTNSVEQFFYGIFCLVFCEFFENCSRYIEIEMEKCVHISETKWSFLIVLLENVRSISGNMKKDRNLQITVEWEYVNIFQKKRYEVSHSFGRRCQFLCQVHFGKTMVNSGQAQPQSYKSRFVASR